MARSPQMNIRVPPELRTALRAAARRRGVSQSIFVRHAIEQAVSSTADLPGLLPASRPASDEAHAALVELVAERTGLPRTVVRRKIERGSVHVDGVDAREVVYVPSEDTQVTLEGQSV